MYSWEPGGLKFLDSLIQEFSEVELLPWLHATIRDVWAINMDRYEPVVLGDTAGAFGILSAHNIRERSLRASQQGEGAWRADRARASAPDGSLLITVAGVNVHILKAPRSGNRTPLWESDFRWDNGSLTRLNAALRNASSKPSYQRLPGQESLFEMSFERESEKSAHTRYDDVFLIWSGEELTGLTAGWLGIPVLGPSPWVAVSRPLWLDEAADCTGSSQATPTEPNPSTDFDSLEEPMPEVRLKARTSREERK